MNTNKHPTTHPAQARELARELRELQDRFNDATWDDANEIGYNFVQDNNATHIAATLDALASENEQLREAAAHYLDTGLVSARNELSKAIGREVEPPSAPGSWRNAAGALRDE